MKLKYLLIPLLLLLLAVLYFVPLIHLPYNIRSQGIIYPEREWVLSKAGDGLLTYTLHDHFNQSVSYHAITEFQRGDHGEFVLNERIFHSEKVCKNDTIGYLRSNEEQRFLMQLQGQLEVNRRLLDLYTAGERPEDIAISRERAALAEKEYKTQQKLMERADRLFAEGVISPQDHELAQNEYQVKRMALQIARSEYQAKQAGAKPEQLELVRAEIHTLESQIEQVNARLSAFTILAPFNGTIIREGPGPANTENILRLADDSVYLVVLPVEVYQLAYLEVGQEIRLIPENRGTPASARLAAIGNSAKLINRRQFVFITAVVNEPPPHLLPNMLIQVEIETGKISLREYVARLTRTIYAN